MKMRTQFLTSVVFFGLVLLAMGVLVFVSQRQLAEVDSQEAGALSIVDDATELSYESSRYLFEPDQARLKRWDERWDSAWSAARALSSDHARHRVAVDAIQSDLQRQKAVFGEIRSSLTPGSSAEVVGAAWKRMAVQNASLAFDAQQLVHITGEERREVRTRFVLLVAVLLAIFVVYLIANYSMVQRRWMSSLSELRQGTLVVGSGNLDFAIPVRRRDEIGELTEAFNRMASDLKGEVASRAELERERSRAEALLRVATSLASGVGLGDVLDAICEGVLAATRHSRVTVSLFDESTSRLTVAASRGEPSVPAGLWVTLDGLSPPARTLVDDRRPGLIDFDEFEDGGGETGGIAGAHLAFDVPLFYEERFIGLLAVDDPSGRREFTMDEMRLLTGAGAQATIAIENARLYESQRRRRRRIETLHGVTEVALANLDVHEAASGIVKYLVDHQHLDVAGVWLAEGDALVLSAAAGYPGSFTGRFSRLATSEPRELVRVFVTGSQVVVENAGSADPEARTEYVDAGLELGTYIVLPLSSGKATIGVLQFGWNEPRRLNRYDVDFYDSIADEVAVVLDNSRLLEREREAARLGDAIAEFDATIHSSLDLEKIAVRALAEGARALGAETAAIDGRVGDGWEAWYEYGFEPSVIGLRFTDEDIPHGKLALDLGKPVAIDDARSDQRVNVELMEKFGLRSVIAAPLLLRGAVFGVLFYNYHAKQHRFTQAEVDFVSRLASSLSLAIDNARLYKAERDIAQTLQETLVVLPAEVPGLRFSRAYRSATHEAGIVGGDFVDVFEVEPDVVGICLGDVSGKGIDAAVTTSLVRNTLRVHALDGLPAVKVIEKANAVLARFIDPDSFVTLWFGLLNTKDGGLTYVSAGHPPGLILGPDGGVRELTPCRGPFIGAFVVVKHQECETTLEEGERLVLYSDGMFEARSPGGEMFGEDRLRELVSRQGSTDTAQASDSMIGEVLAFSDGVLRDDAAVLVVERMAKP